jgi:hypothetical protein
MDKISTPYLNSRRLTDILLTKRFGQETINYFGSKAYHIALGQDTFNSDQLCRGNHVQSTSLVFASGSFFRNCTLDPLNSFFGPKCNKPAFWLE